MSFARRDNSFARKAVDVVKVTPVSGGGALQLTTPAAASVSSSPNASPRLGAIVPSSDAEDRQRTNSDATAAAAAASASAARSRGGSDASSAAAKADKVVIAGASGQSVQVTVRVRPLLPRELETKDVSCVTVADGKHIEINAAGLLSGAKQSTSTALAENKAYEFDCVFDRDAAQQELFDRLAIPLVRNVMDAGEPGTILAYGQTGSGKTFTMQGRPGAPGIIQRVATMFDDEMRRAERDADADTDMVVHASYLELYNECIRDLLLANAPADLQIKEDPLGGVFVKDLTHRRVRTGADILQVIAEGTTRRTVAETRMNAESSRSHAVLALTVQHVHKGDALLSSSSSRGARLSLVDLAGSERQSDTGATGVVLQQAAKINQSLSALGNVIAALCDGAKFVPFRDSKLTRLLSNSFLGRSRTLMIACVSPATSSAAESISTLRFADRAKHVKTRALVAADAKQARIEELEREVRRLRNVLRQCKCGLAAQARLPGGVGDASDGGGLGDDADGGGGDGGCCACSGGGGGGGGGGCVIS